MMMAASTAMLASPEPIRTRPLHVVTISPFYPSVSNPVSACFVAEPLRQMSREGVKSTVFIANPFYRKAQVADPATPAEWVNFVSLPGGVGLPSAGFFLERKLSEYVRAVHSRDPVDLIHAHSALPCGHAASLLSARLGIPFVVTVHGLDAFSNRQVRGLAGKLCVKASREVYRSARSVICVSRKVQDAVTQVEPRANTRVVYNGVDCEFFAQDSFSDSNPIILAVGNLISIKGYDCLLRAVARVQNQVKNIRCRIIGEGPEQNHLQSLAVSLGLSKTVDWLGRRSRKEVAAELRDCAVFALPSIYEALGCAYLEAMATGKPAIGCEGQGIEELIRHGVNGWLVRPNDEQDLANALSTLLASASLRREIGSQARRTMLESCTLEHQSAHLREIYQEVAR